VKANLLDDGVVDTLVSVGATSGVHTCVSINASDSARISSRNLQKQIGFLFIFKCAAQDRSPREPNASSTVSLGGYAGVC
jgi:hypothetical protein